MGLGTKRACFGCVAPKRFPGCQAVCPDFARDDAELQKQKEAMRAIKKEAQRDSEKIARLHKINVRKKGGKRP